jgi:hydroxymethylglutaryl-CoA synthase
MNAQLLDFAVSIPQHYVSHVDLAEARGEDPDKFLKGLGCWEMAVCGPGEDTVTLAASAGFQLFQKQPQWRDRIGLCIIGTETGVDASKPASIHLHRMLELPSSCRVFEVKHACYSGTAALQMARAWVQMNPDRGALVISSDVARYERHSPGESTQGAGAIAMLVGCAEGDAGVLTFSNVSGTHASDVNDFWRPNYQSTACVRGRFSMQCYLDGLVAAYDDYVARSGDEEEAEFYLYHVPFPNMARKAHDRLLEHWGVESKDERIRDFLERVEPSLWANRRVGNIYSGSLYLMLAGLSELHREDLVGRKVAMFSYGSGSCSEFFTGRFGKAAIQPQIEGLLERRKQVDVSTYEKLHDAALAMEKDNSFQAENNSDFHPFLYAGIRDHERFYRNNPAFERDTTSRLDLSSSVTRPCVPLQRVAR